MMMKCLGCCGEFCILKWLNSWNSVYGLLKVIGLLLGWLVNVMCEDSCWFGYCRFIGVLLLVVNLVIWLLMFSVSFFRLLLSFSV